MKIVELSVWDLGLAAALVLALAVATMLGRFGVGRSLIVAAARMTIQLSLIGLVLRVLFDHPELLWVGLMSLVMLLVAAREVVSRQNRRLRGWWSFWIGAGSMFLSSFVLAIFALAVVVQSDPWYDPRYAIPILGMLLGNTMNAIALSLDRLTESAWDQREVIEQRLMLGQDRREAMTRIVRGAVRGAFIPVINAMAVAGIVSLPGMMTGQILAGNSPTDAVKYQILIFFLIAAGGGFGMLLAVWLGRGRLFDSRERLRLDRLRESRD
ncbi:MAG: iron export ABC transporter permease subunit FetB [Verrucomicrobiota bacterium]